MQSGIPARVIRQWDSLRSWAWQWLRTHRYPQQPVAGKEAVKEEDARGDDTGRGLHLGVDRDSVGSNLVAMTGIKEWEVYKVYF